MQPFNELKERLSERKKRLQHRLHQAGEIGIHNAPVSQSDATGELSQYDNHPADSATDLYEREKDIALYEQMSREFKEVEEALDRIKNGTYGVCEVTGERIPYERLDANPTARTIVSKGNGQLPQHRPVEEEVIGSFGTYVFDKDERETEFDAEDGYQSVARFNELNMVYEDASLDEPAELIGYVEEIEAFISTGIEGYTGVDHVDFQRNVHYDHYVEEREL